jgi:exopolysaccharide biosynthesis protein
MRNKKSRTKRKKMSAGILILIFTMQVFTATFISGLFVYFGLFPMVRKIFVGTAMSSYKHQYIARLFFSDSQISKILNSARDNASNIKQVTSDININDYSDNSIERYNISSAKYKGYLLVVKNPLRIKVGYTKNIGKEGERTSDIAKDHNAVAAINGGGFMDKSSNGTLWSGTGAYPTGFVISNGRIAYQDISDDKALDVMALDYEGKMIIGKYSINDLKELKASEAIAFGPRLVVNGQPAFDSDGGEGITARTAIGQREDGAILLLVVDGRRIDMPGATLQDIQRIMLDYNAYNAINLDGGSSSTMYYKGSVINSPCNPLGERTVATALYVAP